MRMSISSPSFPIINPCQVGVSVSNTKLPPAPIVISISPLTLRYRTKSPSLRKTLYCDSSFKPLLAPLISNSPNTSNRSPESTMSNTSIRNSTSSSSISNSLNSSSSSSLGFI